MGAEVKQPMRKLFLLPLALLGLALVPDSHAQVSFGFTYGRVPPPPRGAFLGPVGRCPGPGFAWQDPYWDWRGENYYWQPGRWVRAPRARAAWVPPGWYQSRGRAHWRKGYWR